MLIGRYVNVYLTQSDRRRSPLIVMLGKKKKLPKSWGDLDLGEKLDARFGKPICLLVWTTFLAVAVENPT